jgi:hypothetical protein
MFGLCAQHEDNAEAVQLCSMSYARKAILVGHSMVYVALLSLSCILIL